WGTGAARAPGPADPGTPQTASVGQAAHRHGGTLLAYVPNNGSGTVTPIDTASRRWGYGWGAVGQDVSAAGPVAAAVRRVNGGELPSRVSDRTAEWRPSRYRRKKSTTTLATTVRSRPGSTYG